MRQSQLGHHLVTDRLTLVGMFIAEGSIVALFRYGDFVRVFPSGYSAAVAHSPLGGRFAWLWL